MFQHASPQGKSQCQMSQSRKKAEESFGTSNFKQEVVRVSSGGRSKAILVKKGAQRLPKTHTKGAVSTSLH